MRLQFQQQMERDRLLQQQQKERLLQQQQKQSLVVPVNATANADAICMFLYTRLIKHVTFDFYAKN